MSSMLPVFPTPMRARACPHAPGSRAEDALRLLRRGGRSRERASSAVVRGGIRKTWRPARSSAITAGGETAAPDCRGRPGPRLHDLSLACPQEAGDAALQQPQRARSERGTHQRNEDQQPGTPVSNVTGTRLRPALGKLATTLRCATDAGGPHRVRATHHILPSRPEWPRLMLGDAPIDADAERRHALRAEDVCVRTLSHPGDPRVSGEVSDACGRMKYARKTNQDCCA